MRERLEAFAAGYAQRGVFPLPGWVRVACRAACETDGATPALVEAAGRVEGRRSALIRRRDRIYDQHRTVVLGCAEQLAATVHVDDLVRAVADATVATTEAKSKTRERRKAAALAILLRTLRTTEGLPAAWQQANADAYVESTAEGHAEAAAAPESGGPADPRRVAALFEAAALGLAGAAAWQTADDWTSQQISGLAGDIADGAGTLTDPVELAGPILGALKDALGVAFYLEETMHGAYATGFAVYAQQANATVNFTTAGDGRVESICASYEAANPWAPDGVPTPPVHGDCRCWLETEDPTVPVNGVLTAA